MKRIFKIAFITFLSGAIFFAAAYGYLYYNLTKTTSETDEKDYKVLYHRVPDNCGVIFVFPNNSATLIYLDFKNECIQLLDTDSYDASRTEYFGYTVDYKIVANEHLIEGIIDRVGGIEIECNNETLRYTGIQVLDLIEQESVKDIRKQTLLQIFKNISQNSFTKDDFIFMIENSKSTLSFIDCIDWIDYIKSMSKNVSFVQQ